MSVCNRAITVDPALSAWIPRARSGATLNLDVLWALARMHRGAVRVRKIPFLTEMIIWFHTRLFFFSFWFWFSGRGNNPIKWLFRVKEMNMCHCMRVKQKLQPCFTVQSVMLFVFGHSQFCSHAEVHEPDRAGNVPTGESQSVYTHAMQVNQRGCSDRGVKCHTDRRSERLL